MARPASSRHEHKGEFERLLDKAAGALDRRTDGKHADTIQQVRGSLERGVDKIAEQRADAATDEPGSDYPPSDIPPSDYRRATGDRLDVAEALGRRRPPAAAGGPADDGVVGRLIEVLLDAGIDGLGPLKSARELADLARRDTRTTEGAVKKIVRSHVVKGGVGGFVTGVGGFVTMPIALPANVVEFYVGATRMVAGIATLRGYDLDDPQVRTAVLLALIGSEADEVLAKAGLTGGTGKVVGLVGQQLPPAAC